MKRIVFFITILILILFLGLFLLGNLTGESKISTNSLGMKFVKIIPGTFMMGSGDSVSEVVNRYGGRDNLYQSEHPQRQVTINRPFYMQSKETTVGQWKLFIEDTGYKTEAETDGGAWVWASDTWEKKVGYDWKNPGFDQNDNYPVTCISWNDVQSFLKWLNRKEAKNYYCLPTEVEWEYAARAGTTTPFHTGVCLSSEQANYNGSFPGKGCTKGIYRKKPVQVGSFPPNPWGLYDMEGNVWEWCQDGNGENHPIRGGNWNDNAGSCRLAFRRAWMSDFRLSGLGFRLVCKK